MELASLTMEKQSLLIVMQEPWPQLTMELPWESSIQPKKKEKELKYIQTRHVLFSREQD